jgi:replicative DNA helicase
MLTVKYIGENTQVLLFDGRVKKVQDLVSGDKLMSLLKDNVNIVIGINHKQSENVYRIVQTYGTTFSVHENQMLSVSFRKQLYKIKVSSLSYDNDKNMSLLHTSVPFGQNVENIDMYFIGLFIGNKENSVSLNRIKIKYDSAYFDQLKKMVNQMKLEEIKIEHDFIIIVDEKYQLINQLIKYDLHFRKNVPDSFKVLDLYNKFYLLAGIMDSSKTKYNKDNSSFELYDISEKLHNNLLYLLRSMGYYCYSRFNELYTIYIHGRFLYHIPVTKKYDINFHGDVINNFTAVKIKNTNYFEVETTNEYVLLEDFTLI